MTDGDEMLLNLVRASKQCLDRMTQYHLGYKNLISAVRVKMMISKSTVAFWLRFVILICQTASEADCRAVQIREHGSHC